MLLSDLQKIVEHGIQMPLEFWLDTLKKTEEDIVPELEDMAENLHDGTVVKANIQKLIALLKDDNPNELQLAQALAFIAELFRVETSQEHQELINQYMQDALKFANNAQANEYYRDIREKNRQTFSEEEQKAYDKKLFQNEGMMYCLEYYLALYKAILDAPTEAEKKKFIESKEINLGFGNLPGLWIDFNRDEILGKFIYKIFDNSIRGRLTKSYFNAKIALMKIKINYDEKGNVSAVNWEKTTLDEIMSAFRDFILILFETFQEIGIDQLSSYFFTPYGKNPLIKNIKI